MPIEIDEVRNALRTIRDGGELSFDEVQSLNWEVPQQLDDFVQRIYRELQIFASDQDVRAKDVDYDKSWRVAFADLLEQLEEKARKLG